jgi:hypothetical protein
MLYRTTEKAHLQPAGGGISAFPPGAEVEFDGVPGVGLQPLDDSAHRAKAQAIQRSPMWRRWKAGETITEAGGPQTIVRLATSCTGERPADADAATAVIEKFIAQWGAAGT